jgi:hypothetical protein
MYDASFGRRDLLRTTAISAVGASAWQWFGEALAWAAEGDTMAALKPLNRFPRMVQEWFVAQVRQIETQADIIRAALRTRADAKPTSATCKPRSVDRSAPNRIGPRLRRG